MSTDCNNPDHQHTTSFHPRPPTTKFTTRSTTTHKPITSPNRPTTSSQYPQTFTPRPTTQRPNTYPERPSSTPNPTGAGGEGYLGVQPPSTRPTTPNPSQFLPSNQPPFFIIPYPFPFAPTCPCYGMEPSHNHSSQHQQQQLQWQHQQQQNVQQSQNAQLQWQSQQQFAIGFIPVLFVPNCFNSNYLNQISGQYAFQVPYPCNQCNQSIRNCRELDLNEKYSSGDSFKQVLAQAGVDVFSNSLVKSPHRKRARKPKRIQKVEEPHSTESLHVVTQSSSKDGA